MGLVRKVFLFYRDGFRAMVLGRTLWKIIIIKLVVMFGILKFFFFPDYLQTNFSTDRDRADHVLEMISRPASAGQGSVNEAVVALTVVPPSLQSQTPRR